MRGYRTSGIIAKDRLEYMLLSERMQSSPELMEQMKREISSVVRRYINTEHMRVEIQIRLTGETKQGEKDVKTIQIKRL
ncbi:MAG: cell division topological specificity factor MinE [Eubacteriales bacterium]|nr:cell division topological specificity factor MinE [Eubacteriales bacterium]